MDAVLSNWLMILVIALAVRGLADILFEIGEWLLERMKSHD